MLGFHSCHLKTFNKSFILRFHVAVARVEIDLRDRFDDRVLDASDKIYAASRKMEIINEISPICSLTQDIQDQILDEYDRVQNQVARQIGYTENDDREDVTLLALVSLIMVPRIKTMISKLWVSETMESLSFHSQIYLRAPLCILKNLTWFIENSMNFYNLEKKLKKVPTVERYPKKATKTALSKPL